MKLKLNSFPHLIPGAVSDLFAQASGSKRITKADRYGLMAAILADSLSEEERASIDRLIRSTRRGRVKVVNDVSAIGNSASARVGRREME